MGTNHSVAKMMQAESTDTNYHSNNRQSPDPNNRSTATPTTTIKDVIKNLPKDPVNNALYGLLMEKNRHLLVEQSAETGSSHTGDGKHSNSSDNLTVEKTEVNEDKVSPKLHDSNIAMTASSSTKDIPIGVKQESRAPARPNASSAIAFAPKKRFRQRFEEPVEETGNQGNSSSSQGNSSNLANSSNHGIENSNKSNDQINSNQVVNSNQGSSDNLGNRSSISNNKGSNNIHGNASSIHGVNSSDINIKKASLPSVKVSHPVPSHSEKLAGYHLGAIVTGSPASGRVGSPAVAGRVGSPAVVPGLSEHRSRLSPSTGRYSGGDKKEPGHKDGSTVVSMRTCMDEMMARMVQAPLPELEAKSKIVPMDQSRLKVEESSDKSMSNKLDKKILTQGDLIQQKIREMLKDDVAVGNKPKEKPPRPQDQINTSDPSLSGITPLTLITAQIEAVMRQQPYNLNSLMQQKQKATSATPTTTASTASPPATSASSPSMSYPQLRMQLQGGANIRPVGGASRLQGGSISKGTPSVIKSRQKYDPVTMEARKAHPDTVYSIVTSEIKQRIFNNSKDECDLKSGSSSVSSGGTLYSKSRESTLSPDELRGRSNSWSFHKHHSKTPYDHYDHKRRHPPPSTVAKQPLNSIRETSKDTSANLLQHTMANLERPASYHGQPPEGTRRPSFSQSLRDAYFEKQHHLEKMMNVKNGSDERSLQQTNRPSPHPPMKSPHYPRTDPQRPTGYPPGKEGDMTHPMVRYGAREGAYIDGRVPSREHSESRGNYEQQRMRREEDYKPDVMFQPTPADIQKPPHSFGSITRGTPRSVPVATDQQSILSEAYQIQSSMSRSHLPPQGYDKNLDLPTNAPPPLLPLMPKEEYARLKSANAPHLTLPERERSRSRSPISRDSYSYPQQGYNSNQRPHVSTSDSPLDLSKKDQNSPPLVAARQTTHSQRYNPYTDRERHDGPRDNKHPSMDTPHPPQGAMPYHGGDKGAYPGDKHPSVPPPLEKIYQEEWLKNYTLPTHENQMRKEPVSQSDWSSSHPYTAGKDAHEWRAAKHYERPEVVQDSRPPTTSLPSDITAADMQAAAHAQMMATYGAAAPFGLIYPVPLQMNPALYAVHGSELYKQNPAQLAAAGLTLPTHPRSAQNLQISPNKPPTHHHEEIRNTPPPTMKLPKQERGRYAGVNLLGDHPPDDVLQMKCNLCLSDYGNMHSFLRHFHRDHPKEGEPQRHHVTIGSITKAKHEKSLSAAGMNMYNTTKPGYEHESERVISERINHREDAKDRVTHDNGNQDSVMKCFHCDQEFPTRDWGMFRRHMKSHETPADNNIRCTDCHVAFRDRNEWQLHMSLYHKNHTCVCKVCNVGFAHIETMYKHVHTAHSGLGNVEVEFCCLQCNKSFNNERDLSEHRQHHDFEGRGSPGAHVSMSVRARVKDQQTSPPSPNVVHRVTPDTTCKEDNRLLPSSDPETVISSHSDTSSVTTATAHSPDIPLSSLFPKVSFFEMLQQKVEDEHRRQGKSDKGGGHTVSDKSRGHTVTESSRNKDSPQKSSGDVVLDNSKILDNFLKRKLYENVLKEQSPNKVAKLDPEQKPSPQTDNKQAPDLDTIRSKRDLWTADSVISGIVESALVDSNNKPSYNKDDSSGKDGEKPHPSNMEALMSSLLSLPIRSSQENIKQLMEAMAQNQSEIVDNGNRNHQGNQGYKPVTGYNSRPQFTDSDLIAATVLAEISGSVVGSAGDTNKNNPHRDGNKQHYHGDVKTEVPSSSNSFVPPEESVQPQRSSPSPEKFQRSSPQPQKADINTRAVPLQEDDKLFHQNSPSRQQIPSNPDIIATESRHDNVPSDNNSQEITDHQNSTEEISVDNKQPDSPEINVETESQGSPKNSPVHRNQSPSPQPPHPVVGDNTSSQNSQNERRNSEALMDRMDSFEDSPLVIAWDEDNDQNNDNSETESEG